jgi:glycosyltransferase involved in cell wall biosynthesis
MANSLPERKGKKVYLVQHYEIWDIWNDEKLWKEAEQIEKDSSRLCLAMHDVVPENSELRKKKALVDNTYKLPFQKITISSWLKQLLEEKFREKVLGVIVNGVNFDTFYRENVEKTGRRVLMPYRTLIWKGTEDGLKAFSIVKKKHPEVEFGVYGAEQTQEIPSYVKNYGRIPDKELQGLYNHSDVFALPSWVEGSQLPPMEAMACGCAVATTNVGGISDYAVAGKTCLVSPPRHPEALARNIIDLLEDDDMRIRISEAGHQHIKQFTWERATKKMEETLQSIIDS